MAMLSTHAGSAAYGDVPLLGVDCGLLRKRCEKVVAQREHERMLLLVETMQQRSSALYNMEAFV